MRKTLFERSGGKDILAKWKDAALEEHTFFIRWSNTFVIDKSIQRKYRLDNPLRKQLRNMMLPQFRFPCKKKK